MIKVIVSGKGWEEEVLLSGYNGESFSRRVLERNALDMLEDNDSYGNLSFCAAEAVTEIATDNELLLLLAGRLSPDRVAELAKEAMEEGVTP